MPLTTVVLNDNLVNVYGKCVPHVHLKVSDIVIAIFTYSFFLSMYVSSRSIVVYSKKGGTKNINLRQHKRFNRVLVYATSVGIILLIISWGLFFHIVLCNFDCDIRGWYRSSMIPLSMGGIHLLMHYTKTSHACTTMGYVGRSDQHLKVNSSV